MPPDQLVENLCVVELPKIGKPPVRYVSVIPEQPETLDDQRNPC